MQLKCRLDRARSIRICPKQFTNPKQIISSKNAPILFLLRNLTSFEASTKVASKSEKKGWWFEEFKLFEAEQYKVLQYISRSCAFEPTFVYQDKRESSSRSNLLPVITLGKKDFHYSKRASNLQNGRSFSEVPKQNHQNYKADIDFKTGLRPASDLGKISFTGLLIFKFIQSEQ